MPSTSPSGCKQKMTELSKRFPDGVDYQIAYDTTPFIRESVADVFKTLFEAAVLVGLVVLVFLQNWRSVLIPMIAVPVAIIGTFAVMAAVGFSLNNISLFGLVLAIGIVVDDAIVVVENVERWLDRGLAPREATYKAMDEVTGPVIAVALVLCAVFVPCAFISGITGRFFRQFAVTIAASTVFSAINSLTLSPALAAILLRPRHGVRRDPLTWLLDVALGWFFRLFNAVFGASTAAYAWIVGRLLRVSRAAPRAPGQFEGGDIPVKCRLSAAASHDPHPFRSQSHRLSARRRRAHCAVLMGLRAQARRQVRAAHRGHRPRTLDRSVGEGDHRRHEVAGPGLGRRTVLPDAAPGALPRSGGATAPRGQGLLVLCEQGGTGADARAAARARREAALRRALASGERESAPG